MNLARYKQTIDSTNQRFDTRLFADDVRQQLLQNADAEDMLSLPPDFDRWHSFAQLQYLEIRVRLPNFITRYLDATSMAYGLEVRVPFLDHELVEFCAQIPPALKIHGGQEKYILRQALCHDLPHDILQRKKRGMAAPYSQWVRDLPAFAAELLSPARLREKGYFAPQVVRHMLKQHRTSRADYGKSLLGVLGVHLWDDLFLKDC
jgi:asparagine synthase (glutamine-hydrolysing)